MRLEKAKLIANDLMTYFGLSRLGWRFQFDRAVWRLGVCKYQNKIISISEKLTDINTEDEVLDTILHEIAHAMVGKGIGHGPSWKNMAVEIGCSGKRIASAGHVAIPKKWVLFDTQRNQYTGVKRNRRFSIRYGRYEWRLNDSEGRMS